MDKRKIVEKCDLIDRVTLSVRNLNELTEDQQITGDRCKNLYKLKKKMVESVYEDSNLYQDSGLSPKDQFIKTVVDLIRNGVKEKMRQVSIEMDGLDTVLNFRIVSDRPNPLESFPYEDEVVDIMCNNDGFESCKLLSSNDGLWVELKFR